MISQLYSESSQSLEGLGVSYEELLFFRQQHMTGKRLLLGGVMLLLYDYIMTFEDELDFVWRVAPRFSMAKLLFFANRYLSIISLALRFYSLEFARPSICFLSPVVAALLVLNFATVELILLLRVWVLYSRSKNIGISLGILLLIGFGIILYVGIRKPDVALVHPFRRPPLPLTICRRTFPSEIFFGFILVLFIDVVSFSMIMWKVYTTWTVSLSTPISTALLMHGAAYYVTVTMVVLFSLVAMTNKSLTWPIIDSSISSCLSCIATNRLVLSLRGLYYTNHVGNTTIGTTNSKSFYELGASSQFRESSSTFPPHQEAVDVSTEGLNYNRYA